MKPFVIEDYQMKQYGLIAALVLIVTFVFGFSLGKMAAPAADVVTTTGEAVGQQPEPDVQQTLTEEQQAEQQAAEEKQKAEQLAAEKAAAEKQAAEKAAAEKREAEKKAAEKRAAEKQAREKREAARLAAKRAAEKKAAEEKRAAEKLAREKREAERLAAEKKKAEQLAAEKAAAEKAAEDSQQQDNVEQAVDISDQSSVNKRFYSVQAGMFASKNNAMGFIEELAAKDFEAYVTDFVSSSGTTKYNVRVGRFEERNQAREVLREFQKSFASPAYVVITQ